MKDHRDGGNLSHLILHHIQGKHCRCIILDQFFICSKFFNGRNTYNHLFFPKTFGYLFQKLYIALLGKVQHSTGTACVDQLFHIFHTLNIAGSHYRNFRSCTNVADLADGLVMLFVLRGEVKYKQFITAVIAVKPCQLFHISVT